jgi:hypothetical protein
MEKLKREIFMGVTPERGIKRGRGKKKEKEEKEREGTRKG